MKLSTPDLIVDYRQHLISNHSTNAFLITQSKVFNKLVCILSDDHEDSPTLSLLSKFCDFSSKINSLVQLVHYSSRKDYYLNIYIVSVSKFLLAFHKDALETKPTVPHILSLINKWDLVIYEAYYILKNLITSFQDEFPITSVISFIILNQKRDEEYNLNNIHENFIKKSIRGLCYPSNYSEYISTLSFDHYTNGVLRSCAMKVFKNIFPIHAMSPQIVNLFESYLLRALFYIKTNVEVRLEHEKYLKMISFENVVYLEFYSNFADVLKSMHQDSEVGLYQNLMSSSFHLSPSFNVLIHDILPILIGLNSSDGLHQLSQGAIELIDGDLKIHFDYPIRFVMSTCQYPVLVKSLHLLSSLKAAIDLLDRIDLNSLKALRLYNFFIFRFRALVFFNRIQTYFLLKISHVYDGFLQASKGISSIAKLKEAIDDLIREVDSILILKNQSVYSNLLKVLSLSAELALIIDSQMYDRFFYVQANFVYYLERIIESIWEADVCEDFTDYFEFFNLVKMPLDKIRGNKN